MHTFVGGLKSDIQHDVAIKAPVSLDEAFKLALLYEDKWLATKKSWKPNTHKLSLASNAFSSSHQLGESTNKCATLKKLTPNEV